jgi:hypothetical protein
MFLGAIPRIPAVNLTSFEPCGKPSFVSRNGILEGRLSFVLGAIPRRFGGYSDVEIQVSCEPYRVSFRCFQRTESL